MTGLNIIDRFQCLRNDINLMSADVICISNITSNDNVTLQDFDIIYHTKGMIIYKKLHIALLSVETNKETYYESALCRFQQGYICFIYLDDDIMAFEDTRLMKKLFDNIYSTGDRSLLSIIGGLKSQSIIKNDKSVNFYKIVNKLFVKVARLTKLNNHEIDFIYVNDQLQSSKYVTGIFNNLYTDHSAIFMRLSIDKNDVFHLSSSPDKPITQDINRPLTQDIPNINEESTGEFQDQVVEPISKKNKSVNLLKTVKKLIFKSGRKRKSNTSVFSQESSPQNLSPQSTLATGSQDKLEGNNVLCFCKTTQWQCRYCHMPTCDFCCVGQTAELFSNRVCLRKKCSSLL